MHIGITVKDFKAIATHAESLKTSITALYSFPARPIRFSYQMHGMQCEYTLMTVGEYRGPSVTPTPNTSRQVTAPSLQQPATSQQQSVLPTVERKTTAMPPPSHPASRSFIKEPLASQRIQRPSPPPPKASLDPESLFLPQYEDEDRRWGEKNYDEEEDTVGWSASATHVRVQSPFEQSRAEFCRRGAFQVPERQGSPRDYNRIFRCWRKSKIVFPLRSDFHRFVPPHAEANGLMTLLGGKSLWRLKTCVSQMLNQLRGYH